MEDFKLYSVSDEYVEWLRKEFPNVYSNKMNARTHTRKYLSPTIKVPSLSSTNVYSLFYMAGSLRDYLSYLLPLSFL